MLYLLWVIVCYRLNNDSSTHGFYQDIRYLSMIADLFFYNSFKDAANVVMLHPDKWIGQIQGSDILIFVTMWSGLDKEWWGIANAGSAQRKLFLEIINYTKSIRIPTIFYSIEDPPHYNDFLEIAKCCDYVFTTASEMIPRYQLDCGHNRVYLLMFGINPYYHNPVGSCSTEKLPGVIFSGAWYSTYSERCKDTCTIFNGVISSNRGLKVIDRHFELKDPKHIFPDVYLPYISPAIPHELLQKVHKLYDWAINLNSVKDSETMFANRLYELEAAGNLILSNYSIGVNSHLPVVYTVQDSSEVSRILDTLSLLEIMERQAAGIRHAMTGNTCFDRYFELCNKIGIPVVSQQRNVAVVVKEISKEIQNQFIHQSYPNKELITESELLQRYSDFDMIAFFSDKMRYDTFYLEDMINGFKYTDSDYITKDSYYIGNNLLRKGRQHDFVDELQTKFCTVFWAKSFTAQTLLNISDTALNLPNGYSIDCLNFNADICTKQQHNHKYKLSIIIPVYNNGLRLYGKTFSSLLRSSMFENIEILLIDDGSTDGTTEQYIRYLEQRYDNVKSFFFSDGGSGSAARPRNKGVEIASADYIAFLDSDDEAIGDGYAQLYEIAVNEKFDLILGNTLMLEKKQWILNNYLNFRTEYGSDIIEGDKIDFLRKISLSPLRIQSMIIEKRLITENHIEQVVGAYSEDSFFSWQLVANAKRIKAVDLTVTNYYMLVSGSAVNSIDKKFFQKSLLLEPIQFQWLMDKNLLQDYMDKRFNQYFSNYLLAKLSICRADEMDESRKIVVDIFDIYRDSYNGKNKKINIFFNNILIST